MKSCLSPETIKFPYTIQSAVRWENSLLSVILYFVLSIEFFWNFCQLGSLLFISNFSLMVLTTCRITGSRYSWCRVLITASEWFYPGTLSPFFWLSTSCWKPPAHCSHCVAEVPSRVQRWQNNMLYGSAMIGMTGDIGVPWFDWYTYKFIVTVFSMRVRLLRWGCVLRIVGYLICVPYETPVLNWWLKLLFLALTK